MQEIKTQNKKIKISEVRIDLNLFIHIFCFISVLFIGADIYAVEIIGVKFRLDQIFLTVLIVLLIAKNGYLLKANLWIILFAVLSFVSVVFAGSKFRALLFWLSILYNIFIMFYGFASYVNRYGLNTFISILRKTFYVQFVILLFQYFLKVTFGFELSLLPSYGYFGTVPRFKLWFYEPSYLATYLIIWFALSFYMFVLGGEKNYIVDIVLAFLMLLISTSTTGFVGIALVAATVFVLWFFKGKFTLKKIIYPLVFVVIILVVCCLFSDVYDLFVARLFNMSLNEASGGRVSKWAETYGVFKDNIWFGVGPGNYGLYLGEDAGYVPSNISLELLATLGIAGFIAFYGLTASLLINSVKAYKRDKNPQTLLLVACAYALLIFTIILQANQSYLRLYHWMFLGVLWGGVLKYGKKKTKF